MDAAAFLGTAAPLRASAPGRVNLLGEHTDYNDGFMLPMATPQRTDVALAPSTDGRFHVHSATLDQTIVVEPGDEAPPGFARYVYGCIALLAGQGVTVPPLRLHIASTLPAGRGLSSSAALEVATLRAVRSLLGLALDDVALARLAQRAEQRYAGVQCGILDQLAASLGRSGELLLIDARSLATRTLALPDDTELIVIDSGSSRALADSQYNLRRQQCQQAAAALGVATLREVEGAAAEAAALARLAQQAPPLGQRARHVFSENARVLEAAAGASPERLGQLMDQSHASLRDDFGVSTALLDRLCQLLRGQPHVYGARLTGAGFGGAVVALCRAGTGAASGAAVVARSHAEGAGASLLLPLVPATASGSGQ